MYVNPAAVEKAKPSESASSHGLMTGRVTRGLGVVALVLILAVPATAQNPSAAESSETYTAPWTAAFPFNRDAPDDRKQ